MSMFRPENLNLARRFMAGPPRRAGSRYAGRFPDMEGFSKSPAGKSMIQRILEQMRQRRMGGRGPRRGMPPRYVPRPPGEGRSPWPLPRGEEPRRYAPPGRPWPSRPLPSPWMPSPMPAPGPTSGPTYPVPSGRDIIENPDRVWAMGNQQGSRQVKRETTEYFDGMSSPRQGA